MRVLMATDHRFVRFDGRIYDLTCFTQEFFRDYLDVFSEVVCLCRAERVASLPETAHPCELPGLRFVSTGDVRGPRWQLGASWIAGNATAAAVRECDAVLARVPSRLGDLASREAVRQSKPLMVEVLGDPRVAYRTRGRGPVYELASRVEAGRMRRQARDSIVASYVNESLLPKLYPAPNAVARDAIPCMRMPAAQIAEPRTYAATRGPLRAILVAHLLPYKRHADLIDALAKVTSRRGDVMRLDFAGDGVLREQLQRRSHELGVENLVRFHGHVCGVNRVKDLLDDSDLFVLPSATEGLPRAMLEAMARGLPALGSTAGGIPELLRKEDLFEVGDVTRLVDQLVDLVDHPDRLTAMSAHAVATAHRYSSEVLSPRRMTLYEELRRAAAKDHAGARHAEAA